MSAFTPDNDLSAAPQPKGSPAIIMAGILIFVALLGMGGLIIYTNRDKSNDILAHKGFTHGTILACYHAHKSPKYVFEYNYIIKRDTFMTEQLIPEGVMKDSLMDKTFPVVYDTTATHSKYSPFASYILITPDDFKKFNIPFPDSLKWVGKYIQ